MTHAYLSSDFSHIGFEYQDYKLPTSVQEYIYISKYSRWVDAFNRRETWPETVQRYMDFMYERSKKLGSALTEQEYRFLYESILFHRAMPSMRAMMSSGKAADKDNMAIYNCAAVAVNHQRVFSEILYILACGTGCGFSVERNEIVELPDIPANLKECETVLVVRDSRIGWAQSFQALIDMLYNGQIPTWDLSKLRPAGARLKTFGGTASGPDPFNDLLHFTVKTFKGAQGRKLTSIEIHSLVCKIGDVIISGSVRRSATISLSNLSDDRMRHAKDGEWWVNNPHFRLANNSAVYTERPEIGRFMNEWVSLYESKSGERGIFNRKAARLQATRFDRRKDSSNFLTNPCGEIILRGSGGLCNLSEVVARSEDTHGDLLDKIKATVYFGVLQSTFTDFRYVRNIWKKNADEERLLGVSITGIMDNPYLSGKGSTKEELSQGLQTLRDYASQFADELCDRWNLNHSAAICTVKPSGTVSQLTNSSSGIHTRYAETLIRAYRENVKSPVCKLLQDTGIPNEVDLMSNQTQVFYFPIESPEGSITRDQMTALEQLELWLVYKENWAHHSVSCTIYVKEDEWLEVGSWVYKNFDHITGLSFLPYSDHTYKQAPYTSCTKDEYDKRQGKMPIIDWSKISQYETTDMTESSQTLACVAGSCDL